MWIILKSCFIFFLERWILRARESSRILVIPQWFLRNYRDCNSGRISARLGRGASSFILSPGAYLKRRPPPPVPLIALVKLKRGFEEAMNTGGLSTTSSKITTSVGGPLGRQNKSKFRYRQEMENPSSQLGGGDISSASQSAKVYVKYVPEVYVWNRAGELSRGTCSVRTLV